MGPSVVNMGTVNFQGTAEVAKVSDPLATGGIKFSPTVSIRADGQVACTNGHARWEPTYCEPFVYKSES